MDSPPEPIGIGDYVVLYHEENNGFLAANTSSGAHNEPLIYCNQSMQMPENVPNFRALVFEICICHRYKTNKRYRKMLTHVEKSGMTEDMNVHATLQKLKTAANLENGDNLQETRRNSGRIIKFGEAIELRNVYTGKLIHTDAELMSMSQKNAMKTCMLSHHGKEAQFSIVPKYKVNSEGESLVSNTYISLGSMKVKSHYLNGSARLRLDEGEVPRADLTLSIEKHGFIILKAGAVRNWDDVLYGLNYTHLYHQEVQSYVTAEGSFMGPASEDVHLRVRPVDVSNVNSLFPSSNPNTYWQVEKEKQPYNCDMILWQDQVRLRHGSTRWYLSIDDNLEIILTENPRDPRTVFKFYPINQDLHEDVRVGLNARIEHIVTGRWLRAAPFEPYQKKSMSLVRTIDMDSIVWDPSKLLRIVSDDSKSYDDAFKLEALQLGSSNDYDYVCGLVPTIMDLTTLREAQKDIPSFEIVRYTQVIRELKQYLLVNGEPDKKRQKLLRSLKIMDQLIRIVAVPINSDHHFDHLSVLYTEIYKVIFNYLLGPSCKNDLYIAKHFDLLHAQMMSTQGELNVIVIQTLTEMVHANRTIVSRIQARHMEPVINLLRERQDHLYLIFLSEICVCHGLALVETQNYIMEHWLKDTKNGLYLITRGQAIGRIRNILYISCDNGETWVQLHVFVDDSHHSYSEDRCKFLMHQLDLFVALCAGRNEACIRLITKDMDYINWEEAFLCLQADIMPNDMRAKFCETVIGLFVDVGSNYSVVEHNVLSYVYTSVGQDTKGDGLGVKDLSTIFPVLRDWIEQFLKDSASMCLQDVSKNRLLIQVFKLLSFLLKYGYFDEHHPIQDLVDPIMNVLDGRNDVRVRFNRRVGLSAEQRELNDSFRKTDRFKRSPENKIMVEAKCAALEVLDLIFSIQQTERLKSFVECFKTSVQNQGAELRLPLTDALNDIFDPYSTHKKDAARLTEMKDALNDMFERKELFNRETMQKVLLDLTFYEYDNLLQKAVSVLRGYFLSKSTIFDKAQDAIILVHPESVDFNSIVAREVPNLIIGISTEWDSSNSQRTCEIIDFFIKSCKIEGTCLPHLINQKILFSNDIVNVLFEVFERDTENSVKNLPLRRRDRKISVRSLFGSNAERIYAMTLRLLRALCMDNDVMKNLLFNRIDTLITIKRGVKDLLGLLAEIFTERDDLCERLTTKNIQNIFSSKLHKKQPARSELLEVMCCFGRVRGTNTLIKKNMLLITKVLMQNFRHVSDVFGNTSETRIATLLDDDESTDKKFYISLVYLMATCAELENEFIESFCQSLLSLEEVMETIIRVESPMAKRAFMKFLNEVFIKTAMSSLEAGVSDIAVYTDFWTMLHLIVTDIEVLKERLTDMSEDDIFEKMRDSALERNLEDQDTQLFLYFLDGIVPLLSEIFRTQVALRNHLSLEERGIFKSVCDEVTDCLDSLMPYASTERQGQLAITFFFSSVYANFNRAMAIQDSVQCIGRYVAEGQTIQQRMLKHFSENHIEETQVNNRFRVFLENCKRLYRGENTVEAQLKCPCNRMEYTPEDKVENLPLGEEFQQLCQTFINFTEDNPDRRYANLTVLVKQLRVSQSLTNLHGKALMRQEQLNVSCCQVLRAIVHNEIVRLPEDWEDRINDPQVIRQLRLVRSIQVTINSFGLQDALMPQTRTPMADTTKQVFALEKVLLFNASPQVQLNMYNYFASCTTEAFFYSIRNIIQCAIEEIREIRHRFSIMMQEKREVYAQRKISRQSLANIEFDRFEMAKKAFDAIRKDKHLFGETRSSQIKTVMEDGYAHLLLEVLARMCDGQCAPLQNYIRSQNDNPQSYNLIAEVCDIISVIYSSITPENIGLLTQLFDTVNEIAAGNQENRMVLLNCKMVDFINFILRTVDFIDCSPEQVLTLRSIVADLLVTLTEEDDPEARKLAKEIMVTVDNQSLYRLLTQLYQMSRPDVVPNLDELVMLTPKEDYKPGCFAACKRFCTGLRCCRLFQLRAARPVKCDMYEIGFKYYLVMARFHDLNPDYEQFCSSWGLSRENKQAYAGFARGGKSIEIVKEDHLERVYFRVKTPEALRDSVIEKVKWSVDRTSSASKLRDFTNWIDSVVLDISYTKNILRNPVVAFFTKPWIIWNYVPIILSLVINILMMLTFTAKGSVDVNEAQMHDPRPNATLNTNLLFPMFILALVHMGFSLCLFISFLFNAHPGLDNVRSLRQILSRIWSRTPWSKWRARVRREKMKRSGLMAYDFDTEGHLIPLAYSEMDEEEDEEEDESEEGAEDTGGPGPSGVAKKPVLIDEFDRPPINNKLAVHLFGFRTFYYFMFLLFSVLGVALGYAHFYGYFFFVFHLLNIVEVNLDLKGVIRAVMKSLPSLMWVFLLIVVILYIFTIFAFMFLRDSMNAGDNLYCDTLGHCFITMIRFGFVFDKWIDYFLPQFEVHQTFDWFSRNSVYTIILFCVVTIIMLNIVTGIIVDKFAELRNLKCAKEQDMIEKCFICGRTSYEFETQAKGFLYHIKHEHNMWAYMHFFIFLNETKVNSYTALQLWVYKRLREKKTEFYPMSRAIALSSLDDNTEEQKLDEANLLVKDILHEQKLRSREQERYMEYLRQKRWYKHVTSSLHIPKGTRRRHLSLNELFPRISRDIQINRRFSSTNLEVDEPLPQLSSKSTSGDVLSDFEKFSTASETTSK